MKITFVKNGDKYFISTGENILPFNEENLAKVIEPLTIPAKIYFHNCPFDFIGSIVTRLFDENTDIHVNRINRDNDDSLDYVAEFTKVKELPGVGLK